MGSTPCQVGWGRVGVWVESGTGRGRVGVDSVSNRPGSSRGMGGVGNGSGSYWGRLRFKPGRFESGSGSSRGRVGAGSGSTPCEVRWGRNGVWVESGTGRGPGRHGWDQPHSIPACNILAICHFGKFSFCSHTIDCGFVVSSCHHLGGRNCLRNGSDPNTTHTRPRLDPDPDSTPPDLTRSRPHPDPDLSPTRTPTRPQET